ADRRPSSAGHPARVRSGWRGRPHVAIAAAKLSQAPSGATSPPPPQEPGLVRRGGEGRARPGGRLVAKGGRALPGTHPPRGGGRPPSRHGGGAAGGRRPP